ncbi:hypothetical protein SteCoe_18923 [Stentor coeruleus]|uniref:G-protein coupled receptors family 1 profile domain-containing protein n=1 Tax=Stentor coeruleus TaxID=5963 RepID=A0A1R2BVH1_9CILI|nr:hypothetical protein SteCoe_18923 [Stentor coeruleus]
MDSNWYTLLYFSGLGTSFISSSIVLIILFKIKFKDHSTKVRAYLSLIDILSIIFLAIPYIPSDGNQIYVCLYNSMYYFTVMLHSFWILYISYFLYMIICKNSEIITNYTTYAIIIFTIISSLSTFLVLMISNSKQNCIVLSTKDMMIDYLLITLVAFELVIFTFITYFYIQIRRAIKREIKLEDDKSKLKRNYCFRLLGYPILFFILSILGGLNVMQYFYQKENLLIFQIRILIMAFYPCFNSILYGLTKSSRNYLWYLLLKLPDYKEKEEILHEFREYGLMVDRVFMDQAGLSENILFQNK